MSTEADWDALGLGRWWRRHRRFSADVKSFIGEYEDRRRVTLDSFQRFCRAIVQFSFGESGPRMEGPAVADTSDSILLLGQHHAMMSSPTYSDAEKVEYAMGLLTRMRVEEAELYRAIRLRLDGGKRSGAGGTAGAATHSHSPK